LVETHRSHEAFRCLKIRIAAIREFHIKGDAPLPASGRGERGLRVGPSAICAKVPTVAVHQFVSTVGCRVRGKVPLKLLSQSQFVVTTTTALLVIWMTEAENDVPTAP